MNNKQVLYTSEFKASPSAETVLRKGSIISEDESPAEMVERVVGALAERELVYSGDRREARAWAETLGELVDSKSIVFSTPVMTNAGRHLSKPLSACIVPSIKPGEDYEVIKAKIELLHQQGMGTGFDLTPFDDPVRTLKRLNQIAVDGARSGKEERPVGNMAVLGVYHPKILEFIEAKIGSSALEEEWKFNISVDLDDNFFSALESDGRVSLQNGKTLPARKIFEKISEAAAQCADPGIVFLDRMNFRNPIPGLGSYRTTAPCAEVGLIEGEACQFGYINLAKFLKHSDSGKIAFNYEELERTTRVLTAALDNALDVSIENYDLLQSQYIVSQRRKIGIGVCGVADALSLAGLPYDSNFSRIAIKDAILFINYCSKKFSIELAEKRGSCLAMDNIGLKNRYYEIPGYLEVLYGELDSGTVEQHAWTGLDEKIKSMRMLRNSTTVALPPTGRSALVVDASTGIEPHFSLDYINEEVKDAISQHLLRLIGRTTIESTLEHSEAVELLATAKEVSPSGHLLMAAEVQKATDDSVSKTINLPLRTSPLTVEAIFRDSYQLGMNGASVYIDGTHSLQPRDLSSSYSPSGRNVL
jgi:ribonucleoside-diphosphate reductase alpha chain